MQMLEMEPTYRVVLPSVAELTVMLVGAGGTGYTLRALGTDFALWTLGTGNTTIMACIAAAAALAGMTFITPVFYSIHANLRLGQEMHHGDAQYNICAVAWGV